MINAVVGTGASGNISVTSLNGTGIRNGFTFTNGPYIASFLPVSASVATPITIKGINFTNVTSVSFGVAPAASFTILSDSVIVAVVGSGVSGPVSVTAANGTWSLSGFQYVPLPTITSFVPNNGPVGTVVTIAGSGFDSIPANNIVYFGTVKATVLSSTKTSLTVAVPIGAAYQSISVTTHNLTAYSYQPFIVTFSGGGVFSKNSFEKRQDITVGNNPTNISICDIDGDGKPDIAAEDSGTNISVLENKSTAGILSLTPELIYKPGYGPLQSAITDLDGDGKLDFVISTNDDGYAVTVNKNTSSIGAPSFTSSEVIYISAPGSFWVATADFDGDGKPDLAITSEYSAYVYIYRNTSTNDTISFGPQEQFYTGSAGTSGVSKYLYTADINGDGKPELIVADNSCCLQGVHIFKNISAPGNISFSPQINLLTTSNINSIVISDMDGDNKPDLGVGNNGIFSILQNTSTSDSISFDSALNYSSIHASPVVAGDLDGDGKPDIAVVSSDTFSILKNTSMNGIISFAPKADYTTGHVLSGSISISDLDGDGKPDIVVGNYDTSVSVLINQVGDSFTTSLCPPIGNITLVSYTAGSNYQWQANTGGGFNNINDGTNYTGTNSDTLQLADIPSSWYGYQYRCIVDGNNNLAFSLQVLDTWTGAVDSSWENPANWSCGSVPDNNTDVIINTGAVILNSNVSVRSMTLNPTVNFIVKSGFNLTITN